jgi:hypothetical protein
MDSFQELVEKIHPFEQCTTFLVSNGGIIVGHSDKTNIGKLINEVSDDYEKQFGILEIIKQGQTKLFEGKNLNGQDIILSIHPIKIGDYDSPGHWGW